MASGKKATNFEQSLHELEQLVEALETGNLSLEDSLLAFEKGVRITRECQDALKNAEQKVSILMRDSNGDAAEMPFDDGGNMADDD